MTYHTDFYSRLANPSLNLAGKTPRTASIDNLNQRQKLSVVPMSHTNAAVAPSSQDDYFYRYYNEQPTTLATSDLHQGATKHYYYATLPSHPVPATATYATNRVTHQDNYATNRVTHQDNYAASYRVNQDNYTQTHVRHLYPTGAPPPPPQHLHTRRR